MSPASPLPAGLPASLVTALRDLVDSLQGAAGPNLAGVILYGGLARGRYRPGRSDVNLVILLRSASEPALRAIGEPLALARRALGVAPLIFTPEEVPAASDTFPTKLRDIQAHHVVLYGEDPFHDLVVSWDHTRLRVEQELRNLLLRLRARHVAAQGAPADLVLALEHAARPLAVELASLLWLTGHPAPDEDRTAAIFEAAAAAFHLDGASLGALARLRAEDEAEPDVAALFGGILETLGRAVSIVDALVAPPAEGAR